MRRPPPGRRDTDADRSLVHDYGFPVPDVDGVPLVPAPVVPAPVVPAPVVPIVVVGARPVSGLVPDDIVDPMAGVPPVVPVVVPLLVLPVAPVELLDVDAPAPVVPPPAVIGGYDDQPQLFALCRIECVDGS